MPGYRITKQSELGFLIPMYKSRVQMQQENEICELCIFLGGYVKQSDCFFHSVGKIYTEINLWLKLVYTVSKA